MVGWLRPEEKGGSGFGRTGDGRAAGRWFWRLLKREKEAAAEGGEKEAGLENTRTDETKTMTHKADYFKTRLAYVHSYLFVCVICS